MAEDSLPEAERRDVVRSAYRALRPLLMSESAFLASVRDVSLRGEKLERVLHTIERRSIVHRTEPARGVRRGEVTAFAHCGLSPWAADPESLPGGTRQVCDCLKCQGAKKVACAHCAGSAKVRCPGCAGRGQVPGKRGFAWVNGFAGKQEEVSE